MRLSRNLGGKLGKRAKGKQIELEGREELLERRGTFVRGSHRAVGAGAKQWQDQIF